MGWLKNLRVSYKVVCLIIVAVLSLGFVGWTGVSYLNGVQTAMNDMANRHMKAVQLLGDCSITVRAMQARILETAGVEDRAQIEKNKKDIHDYMDVYEKDWQEYQSLGMHADKEDEVAAHWQAFKTQTDRMLDLCLAGDQKGALDIYNHDGIMAIIAWDDTMRPMREGIQQEAATLNEENSESVANAVKGMLVETLIALVVLGLLAWAITQSIVKPLGKMMADCKRLGDGDFRDEGVHTDEERADEFGAMAREIADMRTHLGKMFQKTSDSAEHIAAASEELTASSQQSAQASNQVAQSVQQASNAVVNQQKGIDVSTESVGNVSETVQKLQGEADKVAEHAAAAFEQAEAGGTAIAASVEQIKSVESTVGESTAIVDQLGARSQEIGQIVETISGIAEQTNRLALNAAIEAARAGEQGRGFSVVADEVRKLAEESAEAAQQIETLIQGIQKDTSRAVTSMQAGSTAVAEGAKSVEGLRETFRGIQGYVNNVSQEVQQMAQAMKEAADAANGISGSIQEIDAQGATVASEMENVSAATEEQSASASEIASASDSLAKLAQDLQGTLQKFQF